METYEEPTPEESPDLLSTVDNDAQVTPSPPATTNEFVKESGSNTHEAALMSPPTEVGQYGEYGSLRQSAQKR
eukprot:6108004-Pyramimonas_sp.AAC.1